MRYPCVFSWDRIQQLFWLCTVLSVSSHCLAASEAARPRAALELIVLGSGGPGAVGRAGSAFALLLDGKARILVDAGPGSFVRAGEEKLSLQDLNIILLTHLHADHAGELPGIVKARAISTARPVQLRIFGPDGADNFPSTSRFIDLLFGKDGAFAYLRDFAAPLTFTTTDIPALQKSPTIQTLIDENGLRISAIAGHHRDAPSIIYRIDYRQHSITFSGDIDPEGHPALRLLARDTDLLVFNSVVLDPPGSPSQLYALHTAPEDIGEIARATNTRRLLLTHLNPAIDHAHKAVLASIRAAFSGPVVFARDRMHVELK